MSEPAILAPPGEVSNLQDPEDVIHSVNFATQVVCLVIVTIIVALRLVVKARIRKSLELDDFGNYGGGYHAWDVSKSDMVKFQKASYAVTLVYVPMVFVIKLSLLAMMRRIFAPDRRKLMIIYGSIVVLLLYYIPALFIKIFFCKPISAYWYGTENGGSCLDQRKVIIADATISMVSDFWILILPLPMLWSLQMSLNKKLRVVGILGAGGLATAFSVWRLVMMVDESRTPDTTWFWIHCVLTGNAEAGIGLICACLPTLTSYFVTRRLKSQSSKIGSYPRNHELSSYNNLSRSKKGTDPTASFTASRSDEAYLFSTIEAAEGREGSVSTSRESHTVEQPTGIQKDVVVSQSYEYVR
ncbi:hypothetical protein BJX96DRAFT_169845 [Aspergillus floccosus]